MLHSHAVMQLMQNFDTGCFALLAQIQRSSLTAYCIHISDAVVKVSAVALFFPLFEEPIALTSLVPHL